MNLCVLAFGLEAPFDFGEPSRAPAMPAALGLVRAAPAAADAALSLLAIAFPANAPVASSVITPVVSPIVPAVDPVVPAVDDALPDCAAEALGTAWLVRTGGCSSFADAARAGSGVKCARFGGGEAACRSVLEGGDKVPASAACKSSGTLSAAGRYRLRRTPSASQGSCCTQEGNVADYVIREEQGNEGAVSDRGTREPRGE